MNDSERRPDGRDDEHRDAENAAREALRATLEEKAWDPKYWESSGRHWEAVSLDGAHDVWAYPAEDTSAPRQALCHVLVPGYDEDKGMWFLGVPSPKEATRLFEEREDLIVSYHADEHSVLDLTTGLAVTQREAERLLGTPEKLTTLELDREAHEDSRASFERMMESITRKMERAYRALSEIGWEDYAPLYAVGQGNDGSRTVEIVATVYATRDDGTLLLDLNAYYCDAQREVWVLDSGDPDALQPLAISHPHTEQYGRARVVVPLSSPDEVPTPGQAMRLLELGS